MRDEDYRLELTHHRVGVLGAELAPFFCLFAGGFVRLLVGLGWVVLAALNELNWKVFPSEWKTPYR